MEKKKINKNYYLFCSCFMEFAEKELSILLGRNVRVFVIKIEKVHAVKLQKVSQFYSIRLIPRGINDKILMVFDKGVIEKICDEAKKHKIINKYNKNKDFYEAFAEEVANRIFTKSMIFSSFLLGSEVALMGN